MSSVSAEITLQSMADGKQYWQHLETIIVRALGERHELCRAGNSEVLYCVLRIMGFSHSG